MFDSARYNYDYNRRELEKRIKKLCSVARGMDMSILPYVNDAQGKFSSRKAMKFINDVIKSAGYNGKKAELYRAFLYCCLRCYAGESMYVYDMLDEFRVCSTFQDILDKARLADMDSESEWIKDMEELMLYEHQEMNDFPGSDGERTSFYITMDRWYEWLTGKPYTTIDSKGFERFYEESSKYANYKEDQDKWYSDSVEQLEAENQRIAAENGYDSYEEYEEALDNEARDAGYDNSGEYLYNLQIENMTEEERRIEEEYLDNVKAVNERRSPAWEEFRSGLTDLDKFIEMYRNYRKLYFEVDHEGFYKSVESMIYSYMYANRLSVCVSDTAVMDEIAVLDDITAQLDAAIGRSRRRNGL